MSLPTHDRTIHLWPYNSFYDLPFFPPSPCYSHHLVARGAGSLGGWRCDTHAFLAGWGGAKGPASLQAPTRWTLFLSLPAAFRIPSGRPGLPRTRDTTGVRVTSRRLRSCGGGDGGSGRIPLPERRGSHTKGAAIASLFPHGGMDGGGGTPAPAGYFGK